MKPLFAIILLLALIPVIGQKDKDQELVTFIWQYNGRVRGKIQIPAGYKEEGTKNYVEGIVTRISYGDGSTITLQSGGMYLVPMLQQPEYLLDKTEEKDGRKIRRGKIQNEELFWREDNYSRNALSKDFPRFPPNIAFDKVPRDRVELFEKALDSFVITREEK